MTAQKKGSMTIQEKLDRQKGINPPLMSATAQFSEVRRKMIITGRNRIPLTSAQGALSERVRKNIVLIKG